MLIRPAVIGHNDGGQKTFVVCIMIPSSGIEILNQSNPEFYLPFPTLGRRAPQTDRLTLQPY